MIKARLKDHEIGELYNIMRDTAKKFAGAEQLRARLAQALSPYIESMDRQGNRIYLAVPYSGTDEQRAERFIQVNQCCSCLMKMGHIVYSPITSNHPIAEQCGLPTGWVFWEKYDRSFIEWCDTLMVLKLKGWKESKGVTAEIAIATKMGKHIEYMEATNESD